MSTTKTYSRWTKEDKLKLLHGLKKYGYRDLRNIAKLIPNKSHAAIRTMIYKYSVLAKETEQTENPIEEWLKQSNFQDDKSMIPEAMLYISLFEDHPEPIETGGIDVSALYDMFYRASTNGGLAELNKTDSEALNSLHEVINLKQTSSTEAEVLEYLNAISENFTKPPEKVYSRKADII